MKFSIRLALITLHKFRMITPFLNICIKLVNLFGRRTTHLKAKNKENCNQQTSKKKYYEKGISEPKKTIVIQHCGKIITWCAFEIDVEQTNVAWHYHTSYIETTKSNKSTINVIALPSERTPTLHVGKAIIERLNCIVMGVISFGASIDDTQIENGEELIIKLGCKNESTTEISSVETNIIESIRWGRRNGHSNNTSTVLASKQFQKTEMMRKNTKSEVK